MSVALVLDTLDVVPGSWFGRLDPSRFAGLREVGPSLILGFAVTAMHYTAMESTFCLAAPAREPAVAGLDQPVFAAVTALIPSLVVVLALLAVIFDRKIAQEADKRAEVMDSHRRTSEQLFQAQKMEAVGQLT